MDWIIGGLIVPLLAGVWAMFHKYVETKRDQEERLDDLTTRVTIAEGKLNNLEVDITEIKDLRNEIKLIRMDITKLITLIEERTKKGH